MDSCFRRPGSHGRPEYVQLTFWDEFRSVKLTMNRVAWKLAGAQRVRRNLVFSAEAEEGSSHQIRHPMFLG